MSEWSIEIKPRKKWYDVNLKEIWSYRDLFRMYVKRNIVVVYKQTVLGPLWFLIQPVLTTIMFMFVFGGLAGISTDGVPQPLFYMSGIMIWNYFSTVFNNASTTFINNASVFGKVYFPRLVVPLANATSELIKLLIQLGLFLAIYVYYMIVGADIAANATLLVFPLIVFIVAIFGMSSGLIVAAMTTKYRDLTQLISFGVQLYMYATPVIYPMSAAPEKYRAILEWNPLAPLFEATRYGFMGCGSFSWGGILYSILFTLVIAALSVVVFTRTERNFMDTV